MRSRFIGAGLGLLTAVLTVLLPAGAQAAAAPSTPVNASAAQVAQLLFVAGDVGRLSQIPSGTEDVVLEKVLQQLYIENPTLAPAQAVSDIQGLQGALSSGSSAVSPATLTVMAGNQRILAILRALTASNPPSGVLHALSQVTDQALSGASRSTQLLGQAFDASADSLDTLAYGGFSPLQTLSETTSLAATNSAFGHARDTLWQQASHESVFDDTQTLLSENPALQSSAVHTLVAMLAPDGTLSTTVGQLEALVNSGVKQINDQNCALSPGATGASPSDCATGALHDAQLVAHACPNANTNSLGCQDARNQAQTDAGGELSTIAAQQAATSAAADALGFADQQLQQAEAAQAQAAAQIASEENQYLDYQNFQQAEKGVFDVANLAATLAVSEIDPVAAFSGLLNVVGDAIGFGFSGPDPNTIILQGLQNVSQQISDFEQYTQTAFHVLDTQLSNLSAQVAQDAYQLSAQLTQAQQQLTQLASQLTTLQGSVDHLQSEVQSLFAQGARNDLGTLVNQYLGYQQANGVPLPQSQFATAAGALYQDATSTALSQTVLNIPSGFDALGANSLVTGSDPLSLDSNINYFNLFPLQVTDSPQSVLWSGPLTSTCATNADTAHGLCLPDPDFWATSARAFAQLLMENPGYVTPTRVQQLNTIQAEGQMIAGALHTLSVNDAGSDVNGTGNLTLDAALGYYQYWGRGNHSSGAPSLPQAIYNEEQSYLNSHYVPGLSLTYAPIDPWGGSSQAPDLTGLTSTSSFTKVPLCPAAFDGNLLGNLNPNNYLLPQLSTAIIGFLPRPVLNAVRLGVGHISTCWNATFVPPLPAGGGPLEMQLQFTYVGPPGSGVQDQVGVIDATTNGSYCDGATGGNQKLDGVLTAFGDFTHESGCNVDFAALLGESQFQAASYPSDVSSYVEPTVASALASVQRAVYNDLLSNGSTLTTGTSEATNVQEAASRLGGANAILDGYISLGLPQSLAADDTLHSLVSGVNADPLARSNPNYNLWGVQPASAVPDQVVNFYKAALAAMPGFDPAAFIDDLVFLRANDLSNAIRPHIVASAGGSGAAGAHTVRLAAGIAAASNTTAFAEDNALIGPTLDRLSETQTALSDTIGHGASLYVSVTGPGTVSGSGISCPGACSKSYTPGSMVTLTPTAAGGATFTGWRGACSGTRSCTVPLNFDQEVTAVFASAVQSTGTATGGPGASGNGSATQVGSTPAGTPVVRCTLRVTRGKVLLAQPKKGRAKPKKGRAKVKPRTVTLAVKCDQNARVRLTGTVLRPLGKKPKRGRQRIMRTQLRAVSANVRAGRALTLTVTLPATAITALAHNAAESVTFTLTATNGNGTTHASARIAKLRRL